MNGLERNMDQTTSVSIDIGGLYRIYSGQLMRFALLRCGEPETAKDIVQEVFTRILEKGIAENEISNWRSFLFVLTRNVMINFYRKHKLDIKLKSNELLGERGITTHDMLLVNEYKRLLKAAVERLPEKQRKVYQLSFEFGMGKDEIAKELGVSPLTVKCQLQMARKEVREYVARMVA